MTARAIQITPRLLTRQQAATYCGLSVGTFSATCPVRCVALGDGRRLERFDIQALDEWIDRMRGDRTATAKSWLDQV